MRPALQNLLYERYPDLFWEKDLPATKTCMCWGFEHHDGWFAIIDALAETITELDPDTRAQQVKEKFGTLRFYCMAQNPAVYAAINAACAFSGRVCEVTGELGALVCADGWFTVRSARQIAELRHTHHPAPRSVDLPFDDDPGPGLPPSLNERLSFNKTDAITALRRRHPDALAQAKLIDFPPRLFDLVDSALRAIYPAQTKFNVNVPIRIDRIVWNQPDGLLFLPSFLSLRRYAEAIAQQEAAEQNTPAPATNHDPVAGAASDHPAQDSVTVDVRPRQIMNELANHILAVTNFASAMSRRMDPNTGHCGPVDDQGRLILPDTSPPAPPDLLDNMHQARELLFGFDSQQTLRPHVFCKNMIKPSLEVRERIAQSIRTGHTKIIMPQIYSRPARNFPISAYDPVPYQLAIALAEQHGWHIALPIEMGQFFMGRAARPRVRLIDHFVYDQIAERHFDISSPFTMAPAIDGRLFSLNAPSQVIFQHIQTYPHATDGELLADARFAAASWLGEPSIKKSIAQDLNADRLQGREAFLAHSILRAAQTQPKVQPQAPDGFDPTMHEANAARIYGWSIEENHFGDLYLTADRIENHSEIRDNNSLRYSTALVWYDLKIGWARTRSRYYRLMGQNDECHDSI